MPNFILYEQQGYVVTLTMNEPERRNPLTGNSAVPDFLAAIDRIHNDRSVRAVILTGAGTAFSSGGDIRDMERQASGEVSGMQIRQEYRTGIQKLPLALFNLEVPIIAAVNGAAINHPSTLTTHYRDKRFDPAGKESAMSDIVLSSGVRSNLLQLQQTSDLITSTQTKLATGKRVNSALDNPINYFTAQGLSVYVDGVRLN